MIPGEIISCHDEIILNQHLKTTSVVVTNQGDRPIQVGSHFHFYEVNKLLVFDRKKAYGKRLDIPSGTAIRFEPGEETTVELIPYSGHRIVIGFNGLVNKTLGDENAL